MPAGATTRRCRCSTARATSPAARRWSTATSRRASPQAYRVYEHRFTTQHVHPGYTEPRAAVASWDGNGDVIVWSNTQLPFDMKNMLAEVLDLPASKVRVIVPGIGGGFGGKLRVGVEHYAAWLARKSRRPVKVMTTSEEELTDAYPRQPTVVTLKTGVTQDGLLLARAGDGCSSTAAPTPTRARRRRRSRCRSLAGPYRTPHLAFEGIAVYTNKGATGSFRAPAGPMAQLRRRIADRPDRRRSRHRSARVPPAQRLSRGRQGTGRRDADERQHRGVPAQGGRRDRLERSQARRGPRQGHRLLVVADHRRLVGRLCEDQSRRHGDPGERRGRARQRRR